MVAASDGACDREHRRRDYGVHLRPWGGGVDDLAHVVRRHVGRHAHRDAGRAVRQQVRKSARKHDGFGFLAVVGRAEIDGVLIDAGQHRLRD